MDSAFRHLVGLRASRSILIALVYVVVFPVLYNMITGSARVPQVYVNAVRSLGAPRWQVLAR